MQIQADILENEILEKYPDVLDVLLKDQTTQKNIMWATNNYEYLGQNYHQNEQITSDLITGANGNVIMPRVQKDEILQLSRVKNMAEVFTPSWICNAQNNVVDNSWFQRDVVFNKESSNHKKWETIKQKIVFPNGKTWRDYVRDKRLEITCGEAPYITSRYDTTTGKFIAVEDRIGLLDRKLRIVTENVNTKDEWLEASKTAFQSTYAYEWQGDSLLLARESMLFTFIENFIQKFECEPPTSALKTIAHIISWNAWQMDGLKGVIPFSCKKTQTTTTNLLGELKTITESCKGCSKDNIFSHNGTYCLIKDWETSDNNSSENGKTIRFIDLLNK